jgi:hypothetical protein
MRLLISVNYSHQESLVSEIPAGVGKIANIFLQCTEKNSRQNIIIPVFWKYLVVLEVRTCLNLFWEYIDGKLFAVQAELSYLHAEGSLR